MTDSSVETNFIQPPEDKEPLHYRLTHEELQDWIVKYDLKWSEVKLYLYFVTLNPFGDRSIDFSVSEVCMQLKMKKSAFYQAAGRLEELGLLDLKVARAKAKVFPLNRKTFHSNGKESTEMENFPSERKTFHSNGKESTEMENRSPEAALDKDPGSPQTIHTFQTFTDSLSNSEREKFLRFSRGKISELPVKPTLPDSWIEAHYQELWQQYQQTGSGGGAAIGINWANHPQRSEYLEALRTHGAAWVGTCYDPAEKPIRVSFLKWAKASGLWEG